MRYPVYVDGSIPMQVLADALAQHGYHIRIENNARMVVDPIPALVRRDAEAAKDTTTVVRMPPRLREAK